MVKKMSSKKGFVFGGIVGMLFGMLIAPKSGEETRAQLKQNSKGWREIVEEFTSKAQRYIHEVSQVHDQSNYQSDGYSDEDDSAIPFDQNQYNQEKHS